MDELQISGKRFISSRRIARENGYTADYIGQLIRGGKIVGQKVGRAWYVDANSFDVYLGSEGGVVAESTAAPVEVAEPMPVVIEEKIEKETIAPVVALEALEVEKPQVKKEEVKSEPVESVKEKISVAVAEEKHIPLTLIKKEEPVKPAAKGLRYYADDAPLLPELSVQKQEATPVASHTPESEVFSSRTARFAGVLPLVAVVTAGVLVVAASTFVSTKVAANISIEAGNTAASYYSFDW